MAVLTTLFTSKNINRMKLINIKNVQNYIDGLRFDGDLSDLRLHYDNDMFSWTAKTEELYKAKEKDIDAIEFKGEGWEMYAWCDVSGFGYWVERMGEDNYIQISVRLDDQDISLKQVNAIKKALTKAIDKAQEISRAQVY